MLVAKSQASRTAQRYQDLHDALAGVQYNGQAVAAADMVIGLLISARDVFSRFSLDNARRWAYAQLDDALRDVQRYRGTFGGMPQVPVSETSWDDLSHAIGRAYNVMWSIQDGPIGTDSEWAASVGWLADAATGTIQALPGIIRDAVHFTSELATDTVGGVAAGLLPLWPLVLVAGAVLVGGVFLMAAARKKGLVK